MCCFIVVDNPTNEIGSETKSQENGTQQEPTGSNQANQGMETTSKRSKMVYFASSPIDGSALIKSVH